MPTKEGVHSGAQRIRKAEGKGKRWVVFVVFNGVDGLPRDAAAPCQLLLRKPLFRAERTNLVVHALNLRTSA